MKCGRKELVVLSSILMCALLAGGLLFKVVLESYSEGGDRAGCILNLRNIQQAVRAYHGINKMDVGDPLEAEAVFDRFFNRVPRCNAGGIYTYINRVPKEGELYCICSHAETKSHVPEDYSDW